MKKIDCKLDLLSGKDIYAKLIFPSFEYEFPIGNSNNSPEDVAKELFQKIKYDLDEEIEINFLNCGLNESVYAKIIENYNSEKCADYIQTLENFLEKTKVDRQLD